MNLAFLFLYGLAITVITIFGSLKYMTAIRKEQTKDIISNYVNWGS